MKISEVAKLTGITVRTLHYYDQIGLLKPNEITEAGYRLYSKESLKILQQILFFRELDFPLSKIKEIMTNPNYDKNEAFNKHRELLIKKRDRMNKLICLVESTIKGEEDMSFRQFDKSEIEENKNKYADEVRNRWGSTDSYKESEKKTSTYDNKKWKEINCEVNDILSQFAKYKDSYSPKSKIVQNLVEDWKHYITNNFYNCTDEILFGLSIMYIEDDRFKKNIDKNGEGTAKFIAMAIEEYCSK